MVRLDQVRHTLHVKRVGSRKIMVTCLLSNVAQVITTVYCCIRLQDSSVSRTKPAFRGPSVDGILQVTSLQANEHSSQNQTTMKSIEKEVETIVGGS